MCWVCNCLLLKCSSVHFLDFQEVWLVSLLCVLQKNMEHLYIFHILKTLLKFYTRKSLYIFFRICFEFLVISRTNYRRANKHDNSPKQIIYKNPPPVWPCFHWDLKCKPQKEYKRFLFLSKNEDNMKSSFETKTFTKSVTTQSCLTYVGKT